MTRLARPVLLPGSLSLLLASWMLSACAAPSEPPASPPAPAVAASAEPLAQQIQTLIGDAACSSDAQCRTIGVGHRACGGPEAWLAWSSAKTDANQLKRLVDAHNAARQKEVQRSGMVSICAMLPDPGASCVAQQCSLRNRRSPAVM